MSTTLNCLGWMQNQQGQNPCMVAQEVGQLCNPEYTVSVTNFEESNYVPNATTTNSCTCSWSIYNLLSACSFCVGQSQFTSWSTWISGCGSYALNDSYLPSGLSLSQGIPFWATTNPSTWENAVFNLTEAANVAEQVTPDVTGGPLSTSTTASSSSSSSVSIGAIVGGVVGGIIIIIIGGLLICWMVRRHRRQKTHMTPTGAPSFNAYQPVTVPSTWNRTPVQPTPAGYARASSAPVTPYVTSPIHSTTSLALTSLASPVSPGFSSSAHSPPIADAADMIAPFLATSSGRQRNRSNTSPPTSKAAEALSERVAAPSGQRARLNPPSYSASVVRGSSGGASTNWPRRLSMKRHKRRQGSASGATTYSGHSRTSTRETVTTAHTDSRTEQSQPHAAAPSTGIVQSLESAVGPGGLYSIDGGGSVEMTHGSRAGVSDRRPPAV